MGCYFDNEKINKGTQISELFTFQMSEAVAWCSTALGMKNVCLVYTFKYVVLIFFF
jgi:hypothetical protein